jgi:adenylate kinase family enzyme
MRIIDFYEERNKLTTVKSNAGIDEVFKKIDNIVKEKVL